MFELSLSESAPLARSSVAAELQQAHNNKKLIKETSTTQPDGRRLTSGEP